ncbi:UNVERIFIED_CONTAM: hypothetical protein K2H54_068126 [Gekko kuhli]
MLHVLLSNSRSMRLANLPVHSGTFCFQHGLPCKYKSGIDAFCVPERYNIPQGTSNGTSPPSPLGGGPGLTVTSLSLSSQGFSKYGPCVLMAGGGGTEKEAESSPSISQLKSFIAFPKCVPDNIREKWM